MKKILQGLCIILCNVCVQASYDEPSYLRHIGRPSSELGDDSYMYDDMSLAGSDMDATDDIPYEIDEMPLVGEQGEVLHEKKSTIHDDKEGFFEGDDVDSPYRSEYKHDALEEPLTKDGQDIHWAQQDNSYYIGGYHTPYAEDSDVPTSGMESMVADEEHKAAMFKKLIELHKKVASLTQQEKDDMLLNVIAEKDNHALVQELLNGGANPNAKNAEGVSVLWSLVKDLEYSYELDRFIFPEVDDYKVVAQLLIKHGIDLNEKNKEGKTLLHVAMDSRNDDLVKLLLQHGAEVRVEDVMKHARYNDLIKKMGNKIVDINKPDAYDLYPLYDALYKVLNEEDDSALKLLNTLFEFGADPNLVNKKGSSVFDDLAYRERPVGKKQTDRAVAVFNTFMKHKADPLIKNAHNLSFVDGVISRCNIPVVFALLQYSISLDHIKTARLYDSSCEELKNFVTLLEYFKSVKVSGKTFVKAPSVRDVTYALSRNENETRAFHKMNDAEKEALGVRRIEEFEQDEYDYWHDIALKSLLNDAGDAFSLDHFVSFLCKASCPFLILESLFKTGQFGPMLQMVKTLGTLPEETIRCLDALAEESTRVAQSAQEYPRWMPKTDSGHKKPKPSSLKSKFAAYKRTLKGG